MRYIVPDGMMLLIRFIFLTIGMTIGILMAVIGILMTGMNFDKKGIGKTPIPLFIRAVCSAVRIYFFSLI